MEVTILVQTHWNGAALLRGHKITVDETTAKRWVKNGIARLSQAQSSVATPAPPKATNPLGGMGTTAVKAKR